MCFYGRVPSLNAADHTDCRGFGPRGSLQGYTPPGTNRGSKFTYAIILSIGQPRTPLSFSVSAEISPICATTRSFGWLTQMQPGRALERRPVQASRVSCGVAGGGAVAFDGEARTGKLLLRHQRPQFGRQREVPASPGAQHIVDAAGIAGLEAAGQRSGACSFISLCQLVRVSDR